MQFYYNRRFMDPNPPGGGTGPTLADLDKEPPTGNVEPVKTEADLAAEAAKKAAEEAQAAADVEYAKLEAEAKNEDGTLKPGYLLNAEGKVEIDPDYKEEGGDDEITPEQFWADVDKLRGKELKVEYPEGVDPLSPEGVHIREKAVAAEAVTLFEQNLQKTDPRGYAYLLHRQRGGDDDSFFSQKSISLPAYETFTADADMQMRVYKTSLLSKGLSEEIAQMVVDKAVKDNKLFAEADAAYKKLQQDDEKVMQAVQKQTEQAQQEYDAVVKSSDKKLSEFVIENKNLNFIIPETDKVPFMNFIRERMEYDAQTKEILLVERFSGDSLNRKIESLFFLYKNGNLKDLIQRAAETQNVRRLGQKVQKAKTVTGSKEDTSTQSYVPLGSV